MAFLSISRLLINLMTTTKQPWPLHFYGETSEALQPNVSYIYTTQMIWSHSIWNWRRRRPKKAWSPWGQNDCVYIDERHLSLRSWPELFIVQLRKEGEAGGTQREAGREAGRDRQGGRQGEAEEKKGRDRQARREPGPTDEGRDDCKTRKIKKTPAQTLF